MSPNRNFYAALANSEALKELIESEEIKNTSKMTENEEIPHLKYPLIWIDLEMTGLWATMFPNHEFFKPCQCPSKNSPQEP